ncbi:MAG TPA: hydrogenase maturation protease [Gaiellaceae bacterium]|nr:hydrogenase maturation protease [Gaiellaceae bacterium]
MKGATVVVIGIGNSYRGDDAAGLATASLLAGTLPAGVQICRCEQEPSRIMDAWAGADAAFVVDAVAPEGSPGTLRVFDASVSELPARSFRSSTHALGLGEIIELSRAMGSLPRRVTVYGIEASDFTAGRPLTPAVADAVAAAAGAITADVESFLVERA